MAVYRKAMLFSGNAFTIMRKVAGAEGRILRLQGLAQNVPLAKNRELDELVVVTA